MRQSRGIEEIIRKAMEEGAFDNLRGKGKPLNLDENPHVDPEWRLAFDMLKEQGFAPAWAETRQQIEQELAVAREALARSWQWRVEALARGEAPGWVAEDWGRAESFFREQVQKVNKKIKGYNLIVPSPQFARMPVDVEAEIKKVNR